MGGVFETMTKKQLKREFRFLWIMAILIFIVSPACSWLSVLFSDDSVVFASLSRMIWYSGFPELIFGAMLIHFVPMLVSFFRALKIGGMSKTKTIICIVSMILACLVLYIGAIWLQPSDGINTLSNENIWHGIMSFGGMLMIFVTYCMYTGFIWKKDKDGARLLCAFQCFSIISAAFAVLNVFDEKSYVTASAVAELYVLTMLSLTGFMTYYLAYRKAKDDFLRTQDAEIPQDDMLH